MNKKTILAFTIVFCMVMMLPTVAQAKKRHLTKADHVTLTFYDGSKISGYLYEHWYRGIYYSGRQNYKFSVVPSVNSSKKEKDEYTVNDVMAIDFDSISAGDTHWRACKVAQFDYEKLMQLLEKFTYRYMCVVASDSAATIFKCNVVLKAPVGDNECYETTQYGVMMHGNPIVYPIVTDGKMDLEAMYHHLKSGKNSRFIRFMKDHFKSKVNCAEVERDPSLFLNVYQDYLASLRQ